MCCENSKNRQAGETGECQFNGTITLISPTNKELERIILSIDCEDQIEEDEILICDQYKLC